MRIIRSGLNTLTEGGEVAVVDVNRLSADLDAVNGGVKPVVPTPFVFLFPELQFEKYRLLELPGTEDALRNLGNTMRDPGLPTATGKGIPHSGIPSAYTYFGQFVDHDLTSETVIAGVPMNQRSPNLDLDSVYGPGSVSEGDLMKLDVEYDLPRAPRSADSPGRKAEIPEPRNDENLIIAQLHVAFLRAHNNAVKRLKLGFEGACKLIRQHYQCIVLDDFLKKIADPAIVNKTREGNEFFFPQDPLCMPMEFSLGAYRFGHSMVRDGYNRFNLPVGSATLDMLFTFTGPGGFMGNDRLPESWTIDWKSFVDVGGTFNPARRIDTVLVKPLFYLSTRNLPDMPGEGRLPVRNLLKGYYRKLPTGQAVAERMKIPALTQKQIEAVAEEVSYGSYDQLKAVSQSQFTTRTPLWYYVLAEAAHYKKDRLGPVGSTLVAEVLIGILRRSEDSILGPEYTKENPWRPHPLLSTGGKCHLSDLLKFAGVLS